MGKVDRKLFKNVKVIKWKLQHNLVVVDVDKKKKQKTEWKPGHQKLNVIKLRHEPYRQLFVCKVKGIISDNNHDLWESFKENVLKASNDVFGNKKKRKCNANMWWWNSGVEDEIQKKKEAYQDMGKNLTEKNQK